MSDPLTFSGAPAQGGTAVERAEHRVDKLEEKEEGLTVRIKALEERLDGGDVDLKAAGVTGLGQPPITDDTIKDKLADLKKEKNDTAEQLKTAREDLAVTRTLVTQRVAQAPQGNVDKEEIEMMKKLVTELKGQRETKTQCATLSRECNVTHVPYIYPRKCYKKGLKHILRHWGCKIFRFGGTPGIGKTTFRYWVLWRWVHGETQGLQQKHCLFSIGTDRLVLLTRGDDGKIAVKDGGLPCRVYAKRHSWSDDCVGVVEMSKPGTGIYNIPEQQCPCVSFLIVVGSPGKFNASVPCFKHLGCVSPYYFPAWDADEAVKLPTCLFTADKDETVNEAVIRRRCDEYGGVLRLMIADSNQALTHIDDALQRLTLKTIEAVVEHPRLGDENDIVHRLLLVDERGAVSGFISDSVARVAMKQLDCTAEKRIAQYMQTAASSPKGQAMWGHYFEQQFGQRFGTRSMKLKFKEADKVSELEGPSGGRSQYRRGQETLKEHVLHQPPASFQGVDFFMRAQRTIYYLQTTVSSTHTAVDPEHGDHTELDELLKKCSCCSLPRIKKHIIYVVPDKSSAEAFTTPNSPDGWVCIVAWPEPGVLDKRRAAGTTAPAAKRKRTRTSSLKTK